MKKLLVGTAAVALGLAMSAPAKAADGLHLDVGGYFKGYGNWVDQDEGGAAAAGTSVRSIDILRDTEVHFTGETTLDNGLTVGFHTELEDDNGDGFAVEESYAYFSGAWGRVNLGAEDGAAYLLQVAAPSADANVDGLRQYINPVSFAAFSSAGPVGGDNLTFDDILGLDGAAIAGGDVVVDLGAAGLTAGDIVATGAGLGFTTNGLDYDQAVSGNDDKLTYLTPVFSGFQFGLSYTPELGGGSRGAAGNSLDDEADDYGDVWDLAARWEGTLGEVGVAFGGGFSHAELEDQTVVAGPAPDGTLLFDDADGDGAFDAGEDVVASQDDRQAWNVGLDLNWGAFGLGAAYLNDDNGVSDDTAEQETWVVGIDYTTGPFKLGASYLNTDVGEDALEADRWTGGVVYTYGPGMTFRGSVSFLDADENIGTGGSSADATAVTIGTQIDF